MCQLAALFGSLSLPRANARPPSVPQGGDAKKAKMKGFYLGLFGVVFGAGRLALISAASCNSWSRSLRSSSISAKAAARLLLPLVAAGLRLGFCCRSAGCCVIGLKIRLVAHVSGRC